MQTNVTVLTDDLDAKVTTHKPTTSTVRTVRFMLDGTDYEVDVGAKNEAALLSCLEPFISVARVIKGENKKTRPNSTAGREQVTTRNAEIRQWARSRGHQVADRGQIPADLVTEYELAEKAVAKARTGKKGQPSHISLAS